MTRSVIVFFFNDTATTEIYTLSLHDALPISRACAAPARSPFAPPVQRVKLNPGFEGRPHVGEFRRRTALLAAEARDRKSTRLNSSHSQISYAVFCLKKKRKCYMYRC